jgi:hypothetical protein
VERVAAPKNPSVDDRGVLMMIVLEAEVAGEVDDVKVEEVEEHRQL